MSLLLPWEYTLVITPEQLIHGNCFPVYTASCDICEIIWGSLSLMGEFRIVTPYSVRKSCIRFEETEPLLRPIFFICSGWYVVQITVQYRSFSLAACLSCRWHQFPWEILEKTLCWNSCIFGIYGYFYECVVLIQGKQIIIPVDSENDEEPNIKKILATQVLNDRAKLQDRK